MDFHWLIEHPRRQVSLLRQWLVDFQGSYFSFYLKQYQKNIWFYVDKLSWFGKIIPLTLACIFSWISSASNISTSIVPTVTDVVPLLFACNVTNAVAMACFFLAKKGTVSKNIIVVKTGHMLHWLVNNFIFNITAIDGWKGTLFMRSRLHIDWGCRWISNFWRCRVVLDSLLRVEILDSLALEGELSYLGVGTVFEFCSQVNSSC